jgi:hypothetical protein
MRKRPPTVRFIERLERFIERLELLVSRRTRIDGFSVAGTERDSPARRGIEEALNLIKRHDRVRYERLRRDLAFLWVRVLPGLLGGFHPTLSVRPGTFRVL